MNRWEKGMLAKSLAGHDKDKVYVIMDLDDTYVYLADGKLRTLDKQKKKKKIHVQLIMKKHDIESVDDVRIKHILSEYMNDESGMKEEK